MIRVSKKLSADELIPGGVQYDRFLPEMPEQIHFYSENYVYTLNNVLQARDCTSGRMVWELPLSALNRLLKKKNLKSLKKFPEIHWLEKAEYCCWIRVQKTILFINCQTGDIYHTIRLKKEWENFDFNEQKRLFAYTEKNGLYLLSIEGETSPVFLPKNRAITAGQAASRNEFGICKGTFWSPEGSMLAFYNVDESGVANYPLVCVKDPVASLQKIRYPMTGKKSQNVELGLYNVDKNETLFLESPDEKESYLTCVSWSPDEKDIYLAELSRSQKECKVKRYSSFDGKPEKILFSEKEEKYTEPRFPLFFPDDNPGYFVWQSRRDGFNHLYLYDENGNLIRQLTQGDWEVTELAGYDKSNRRLIFLSTAQSPLNRNVYAVPIDSGDLVLLTPEEGTHHITISTHKGLFIDNFSSVDTPGKSFLRSLQDGKIVRLLQDAPNPYRDYLMPNTEIGTICREENSPALYYRIVRPKKLIPRKKYPLVFYVYGGPHVQLIHNEWFAGTKGFEYLMANEGYVVFSVDPRGSANRGKAFEEAIWRNIGKAQIEDYLFAVEWLLSEKNYIDKNRLGVYGWSFGGFMAASLMLKTELFKVGVAGGAVIDWSFYEAMYTERYMETPDKNREGYKENNLRNFIENLKGELLLIHCDNDPVVLWQNTLSFLKKSVRSKKQVDYFVYPGYAHNVQGADRVHLMVKIKRYLDEKL